MQIEREVLADVKFGELITPTDAEIVFGHLEHHRERLLMPEDIDSNYEQQMAAAMGRPVPAPPTGRHLRSINAGDDCDELDVRSSWTCGSFGLSSTRVLPEPAFLSCCMHGLLALARRVYCSRDVFLRFL